METTNKTWKFKSVCGEYIAEIKNDKLCLLGKKSTFNKTDVLKIPNISKIITTAGDLVYSILILPNFIKIGCCEITYKQLQEIQYEFKRKETQVQNKTIEIKKYKHTSGKIAIQIADTNLYQVQGSEDKLAEWLLVDSQDWEEIKEPEFKEGDFVTVTKRAPNGASGWWNIGDVYKVTSFNNSSRWLSVVDKRGYTNGYPINLFEPRFSTEEEIERYNISEGDYMIYTEDFNSYWSKGRIFRFKEFKDGCVYEIGNKYGAYYSPKNCRKATPEEVQAWKSSNEIKIGNYIFENSNGLAKFGCQEFSKSELLAIKKLFNKEIGASIIIFPEGRALSLTVEFLDKVINKL